MEFLRIRLFLLSHPLPPTAGPTWQGRDLDYAGGGSSSSPAGSKRPRTSAAGPGPHQSALPPPQPGGAAGTVLRTKGGDHTLAPRPIHGPSLAVPDSCTRPSAIQPFLAAASLLLVPIAASAAKVKGTCARFMRALAFFGVSLAAVTGPVIAAYVVLRCAPPVDAELPDGWSLVSPVTAAGDIDTLRRAARLGLEGMAAISSALLDPIVSALLIAIGGRVKRLKTAKPPLLYSEVAAAFARAKAKPTAIAVRDAFALVIGFHFAMRASEILSLRGDDLRVVDGDAIQLRFANVKNRRTVFSSHDPFVVTAGGPLLIEAYTLFNEKVGFRDDLFIFHQLRGSTEHPLSRDWLAGGVRAAAPNRTPHSLRVGAATELYASGVPLATIMAIGRWTSTAACLYVLGTLEDTVEATRSMGSAGVRITSDGLRRATRATIPASAIARADAARWVAACTAAPDS